VELFDGQGGKAVGRIDRVAKSGVGVAVENVQTVPRPQPRVEVAFAVPKGKRLDWLLEKATELSAERLSPVEFARSVATPDLDEHGRSRWQGICVAGAKQSGLDFLPEISPPRKLGEFLRQCSSTYRLVGDPRDSHRLPAALAQWQSGEEITLLIGPEGGITDAEMEEIRAAGFAAVQLGQTILRVETAAVAMLSVVQAIVG
jgi:16S rRNA (uracil1498-N3)-methyltransferase